jgi:hypothetical protein
LYLFFITSWYVKNDDYILGTINNDNFNRLIIVFTLQKKIVLVVN